ncbi:hypothetical protein AQZ52_13955 [Novosphingobium fuchskuhlense]|uniref:DUF2946 domain-containing protein n=1 Tax=Novosphingobium fuchskuhlense TaxID=1117702 RepID=A0A117UU54_9SPHN|nr:DUF2946 family protein [Novosphingobium fuchskuhlense]KUR70914.1 hypothetical protein AQZ52_13955 [Novosphingobium fuchskuhlense]
MQTLRVFFRGHYRLAMLLACLALVLKAAVPSGYMVGSQGRSLTILVCGDVSGDHLTKQITIPASGKSDGQAKAGDTCPYASLSFASLEGGLPPFIALAIAFLLLLGFAPVRMPSLAGTRHVRPPLRGPPALI